jgi:hypothetical protein
MIGKLIYGLLSEDVALTALVSSDNIYPYFLREETKFPAIVYTIDGITPDYTKDGWAQDDCSFSVVSLSTNYTSLQSIVVAVREALEMERGTVEGITIQHIHMIGMDEGYDVTTDIFANKLSFNVNVINY